MNGESCTQAGQPFTSTDQPIEGNIWRPTAVGEYVVKAVYKDLESNEINIKVEEALNKKILVEYFTSRTCGWCPWAGYRVDSLHHMHEKVISYSIHGQDILAIPETYDIETYQNVGGRPSIRLNRRFIDGYTPQIHITPMTDEIDEQLSHQPQAELAIQTTLTERTLDLEISVKDYGIANDALYLTLLLVEDNIVIQDQYNYFSRVPAYVGCPYVDAPHPIPQYQTHNVVRQYITSATGEPVSLANNEYGEVNLIKEIQMSIDESVDLMNASIIAILHNQLEDIEQPSVLNTQICKVGEHIGFKE